MKRKALLLFLAVFLAAFLFTAAAYAANQTTSSTAASVFISRARAMLNEPSAAFWTDAELLQWLNDGTMDIVSRTHCLESTEEETLVAATISYALGNAFITIKGIVYDNTKSLRMGSIEHMGDIGDIGEPAYWFSWGNAVIVYPAPDATAAGDTITAYMVTRPTALTLTSSNAQVPAQYDKALVLYMTAQGLMKDEKYAKAAQIIMMYQSELDRYRQDLGSQRPTEAIR